MTIPAAQFIEKLLQTNSTFAVYRLPSSTQYHLILGNEQLISENNYSLPDKAFVFAPFQISTEKPFLIIHAKQVISFQNFDEEISVDYSFSNSKNYQPKSFIETTQATYTQQVAQTVESIKQGNFTKAIISGIISKKVAANFSIIELLKNLGNAYQEVMVYLVNNNTTGCWLGATPELLMKYNAHVIETVSLAGTKKNIQIENINTPWQKKEIEEQQVVTEHIIKCFQKHFAEIPLHVSETKTISTGFLLHLRTDFKLMATDNILLEIVNFLDDLHPTPAIAGSPKDKAIEHISHTELHNREYYTGFLGTIGIEDYSYLFVNLRCLCFENNQLNIYVGAGITENSIPEKEWAEIQLKAQTILSVMP